MGNQSPEEPRAGWLQRLEEGSRELVGEKEEFPRLSREDLDCPERYHQRLLMWLKRQK